MTQAIIASPTGTRVCRRKDHGGLGDHLCCRAIHADRLARREDRRRGFDRKPHRDVLTGGDSTENTAGMVG